MNVTRELLRTELLTAEDVAQVVNTTTRSVQRWVSGDVSPRRDAFNRLLELKAVVDLAVQVMPAAAGIWLRSPVPDLDYNKPLEVVQSGGYRQVIAALNALGEGVIS